MSIKELPGRLRSAASKTKSRLRGLSEKLSPTAFKEFFSKLPSRFKKENHAHSLATWLSISFVTFSLIILAVLLAFQTLFFGAFYKAIKTKNITTCASGIIDEIDHDHVDALIDMISIQNDVDITLSTHDVYANFHEKYSSIVTDDSNIDDLESMQLNNYFIAARNNGGSYITVIKDPEKEKVDKLDGKNLDDVKQTFEHGRSERLIYAASFYDDSGTEYLLLIESVVTPSRSTIQTLLLQLRIIVFILIAISIVMTVVFSKRLSKPIENINNSARELAQGDYDVEFTAHGYREVEQLGETLNYATSELRQVDQMRKDLIANVSHDLRTPLTLITGYGEVMKDIPGENTPENIQIIIDEATRLTSLVNDLIDISKIEAGTMKLEASVFCITDTIKEMFGRYNKLKEQDGFSFTLEHDQDVYVYADQLKISQVIYNLVNNAVNYAGESKEITVRQICYDNRVRIEVIDNGPGIPQEKLKNIWDRYYKVDKSHRSAKIGTGLGLSIVKTVLKLHKAQFGVFSKVGKGTVFWFELYRTNKDGEPL